MSTDQIISGINDDKLVWLDERHAYVKHEFCERWTGILELHRRPDGGWCRGSVWFKNADTGSGTWTVISEDPLTLSPSILCNTCGEHGYIEQGRWRSV